MKWYRVIAVLCAAFMMAVSLVGCGSGSRSDSGQAATQDGQAAAQAENKTEFTVGEIIAFDGKEVTITSVERNWSTGNEYMKPSEGKEFVKVNVTIVNTSKDRASYNVFDWKMQDSGGALEGVSAQSFSASDSLGSGELVEGGTKSGSLVFEVPAGDPGLILHYEPSFWSSKEVTIKL